MKSEMGPVYLMLTALFCAATLPKINTCTMNCTTGYKCVTDSETYQEKCEYINECDAYKKTCIDQWENFPGSSGLSQCYVKDNTPSCGCLASAYNTGSKCLSMWWLVGPAAGGGCILLVIFTTAIICIKKNRNKDKISQGLDRERNTTDASLMNLAEFSSNPNSGKGLNEESDFEPVLATEGSAHCECTEKETGEHVCYDKVRGVQYGLYNKDQGVPNRGYHGLNEYDNAPALRTNSLYVPSNFNRSSGLYDEIIDYRPLSVGQRPSHQNNDIVRIPRPSVIPEEPEPF